MTLAGETWFRFTWAFHAWAGERLFVAAAELPDLHQPGVIPGGHGDGSLHDTLAHIEAAERHWLRRWEGDPLSVPKTGADYPHLAAIVDEWRVTNGRRIAWLKSLPPAALEADLHFIRSDGIEDVQPLWQTILHVANHTTHHRAEACAALTAAGLPPESADLIDFMRAGSPGAESG
jgi:uncharacterized damage-inducible protein DinB